MKGVIFNILERVVTDAFDEDTWDDLLDASGADGAYTSMGTYPDEELMALVAAASERTGMSSAEVVRWFGQRALPLLAEAHPEFFAEHSTTFELVHRLNDTIHAEVRTLYPEAIVPTFDVDERDDHLEMIYRSPRRLCHLAIGFLEGTATYFGEVATVHQPRCMHDGAPHCVLQLSVARVG